MSDPMEGIFDLGKPYGIELKLEGLPGVQYFWFAEEMTRNIEIRGIRRDIEFETVLQIEGYNIPISRIIWWLGIHFDGTQIIRDVVE